MQETHPINGLIDGPSSTGSFKQILKVWKSLSERESTNQNAEKHGKNTAPVSQSLRDEECSKPEHSPIDCKESKDHTT